MEKHSRVCAHIDLDAILFNAESIHQNVDPNSKIMAVIKTDAYGHGAVEIARELEHLDYIYGYGVATVEEGIILRKKGMRKPILILGYVFREHYYDVVKYDIAPAVFTIDMARDLSNAAIVANKNCRIHLAVDTGMGRIGYQVTKESADEMEQISKLPNIIVEGIFTHFSRADEPDRDNTEKQMQLFKEMIAMLEDRGVEIPLKHCSNSAGIVEFSEANMDLVRAGVILYGMWPSAEVNHERVQLKPAMRLVSHVAYVKTLEAGRAISYGGTYVTQKDTVVATIPVGYGDGYCRGLSNKGYVLIHGMKAPIIGRVCMDQFMVDVSEIPDVAVGDKVTLIGKDGDLELTMEEIGELSGRFNYEFACDLGKRIPRVFYKNGEETRSKDYFSE